MEPRHTDRSPVAPLLTMESMNLDFLDDSLPVPGPKYQAARIEFIGGLGYTLNEFEAYVRLKCFANGFRIEFREPLYVPAEALLGRRVGWGYVTDVCIHTGGHTLSLGTLYPGSYPRKIQRGEVFGVTQ